MIAIPMPRLLPATIAMLAALLGVKSVILIRSAVMHSGRPDSSVVSIASAAGTEHLMEAPRPVSSPPKGRGGPEPKLAATPSGTGQEAKPAAAEPQQGPPVSDSEKALLLALRQRRKELDAQADALNAREAVLGAAEQKIGARVTELQQLQRRLEGLEAVQKQKEDAGWLGLVKMYEAMKPKDAATIFNELSMPVLLQVLDRMKDTKAAAVLAAMTPDKARDVTAELAQLRTGRDPAALGAPTMVVPASGPPAMGPPALGMPALGMPAPGMPVLGSPKSAGG